MLGPARVTGRLALALVLVAGFSGVAALPAAADTLTVGDTAPLPVADRATVDGPPGLAARYPATVDVAGMTGGLTAIEVTLTGVAAEIANDLDVLLVGPTGQNLVVLSDAGGVGSLTSANGDVTLSSSASTPVPRTGSIVGTWAPTNTDDSPDVWPAPAPTPSSATDFTPFLSTDPNGTWSLYIVDDATGDTVTLQGGWSLTLTTEDVAQPGELQAPAELRVREGLGSADVVIERVGGSDGPASVSYATADGTAVAGTDYVATSGTATFADGQTEAVVTVPLIDDDVAQGADRDLSLTLTGPEGATLGPASTLVVIEDDDARQNTSGIRIPGDGTVGPGGPYPSNLHVQGAPASLTDVNVTLSGLTHSFLSEVAIVLVGPQGQSATLVRGLTGPASTTFTLDDEAELPFPGTNQDGTFRPPSTPPIGALPAPAPPPPYGTTLSVFDGTDGNGTWALYAVDLFPGDVGSLDGWSLELTGVDVDAGGPYTIDEGSSLSLAASISGTSQPVSWAWDLDSDGVADDAIGATPTVEVDALTALGLDDGPLPPRTVTAVATLPDGSEVSGQSTVAVTNVAPTGALSSGDPVVVGTDGVVTVSDLDDVGPLDLAAGLEVAVDLDGDGTADETRTWFPGDEDPVVSVPAALLTEPGDYPVTATVTDKDGGSSTLTGTVVVQASTPTGTLQAPASVDEGSSVSVAVVDVSDPAPDPQLRFSFDLDGDGAYDGPDDVEDAESPELALPAALTDDGDAEITITARVSNRFGNAVESTATIEVLNVAPAATFGNDGPVDEGDEPPLVRFTDPADPSSADTEAGFRYGYDLDADGIIDAGDGTWAGGETATELPIDPYLVEDDPGAVITGVVLDVDDGATVYTTEVGVANVAPTAVLGNDGPGTLGDEVTVRLSAIDDVGFEDVQQGLEWSFDVSALAGDGDPEDLDLGGQPLQGTFKIGDDDPELVLGPAVLDEPGSWVIGATVTDKDGGSVTLSTTVVVESSVPVAELGTDGPTAEGSSASVVVLDVVDPAPGAVHTYRVDVDGDGAFDGPADLSSTEDVIPLPGALTDDGPALVSLSVEVANQFGGASTSVVDLEVLSVPPSGTLTGGGEVVEGAGVTLAWTGVADPSTADTEAGFRYAYDLDGDGAFDGPDDVGDGTYEGSPAVSSVDVPAELLPLGEHVLTALVVDKDGASTSAQVSVQVVSGNALVDFAADGPVDEGGVATVTFTLAQDDPDAVYDVDADGDGVFEIAGSTSPTIPLPAELTDDGPAELTVLGRARFDGVSETAETRVQVVDVVPTVIAQPPTGVVAGVPARVGVDVTDPSSADTAAGFVVEVDWGDGTVDTVDTSGAPGATAREVAAAAVAVPEHVWADAGAYDVVVSATDKDGSTGTVTAVVEVAAAPDPEPTPEPTDPEPTPEPTDPEPTTEPTPDPTVDPDPEPTVDPNPNPNPNFDSDSDPDQDPGTDPRKDDGDVDGSDSRDDALPDTGTSTSALLAFAAVLVGLGAAMAGRGLGLARARWRSVRSG